MAKVAINAGHMYSGSGYEDKGASGMYSLEGDIARAVANVVCDDLQKVGYEILFIQDDGLKNICDMANGFNGDVFVSIHCNSADNPKAHGTETWYHTGSEEGPKLAQCVQNQLVESMGTADRGIKKDTDRYDTGFAVTRDTKMPACLTELAFISNADEEDYMNDHIELMAHAVARGITDYFAARI